MYFSLIQPAPGFERDAARGRSCGPYEDHQWLWRFFPAPASTPRDFLYRRLDADSSLRFYCLSKRMPEKLDGVWRIDSREYSPKLRSGDRLRFDLRANPVITSGKDGSKKRHDVVMKAKKILLGERGVEKWDQLVDANKPRQYELVRISCMQWLLTRAERLGFSVDEDGLSVDGYARHRGKQGKIRFSVVDFSGVLTVVEPKTFLENALLSGIGHAKAFGCGLLLVRRVS
jgi:CRISPR system Cascade subunit CasE